MNGGHWFPAYVGIGSNLDNPARQVETAFGALDELPSTRVFLRSSLYRSAPFGGIEQPDFVNAVAALLTQLDPEALLQALQGLQRARGRDQDEVRWGPRVLDLDLLVYSGQTIDKSSLRVPHPGIAERNFVLLPLAEIAPELRVPALGQVARIPVNPSEPRIERIGVAV